MSTESWGRRHWLLMPSWQVPSHYAVEKQQLCCTWCYQSQCHSQMLPLGWPTHAGVAYMPWTIVCKLSSSWGNAAEAIQVTSMQVFLKRRCHLPLCTNTSDCKTFSIAWSAWPAIAHNLKWLHLPRPAPTSTIWLLLESPQLAAKLSSTFCIPVRVMEPYRPSIPSPPPNLPCRSPSHPFLKSAALKLWLSQ